MAKTNGHHTGPLGGVLLVYKPEPEPRPVAAGEVEWECFHADNAPIRVRHQTWYGAREKAMRAFGCESGQVDVRRA